MNYTSNANSITTNNNNDDDEIKMPKKKYFRTRAHCNPLSHNDGFSYPISPDEYNWQPHYPKIDFSYTNDNHNIDNNTGKQQVSILDIGMGFGGLSVELAQLFPDKLILGMVGI